MFQATSSAGTLWFDSRNQSKLWYLLDREVVWSGLQQVIWSWINSQQDWKHLVVCGVHSDLMSWTKLIMFYRRITRMLKHNVHWLKEPFYMWGSLTGYTEVDSAPRFFRWWKPWGQTTWGASCVRGEIWISMSNLAAKLKRRLSKMSAALSHRSSWLKRGKCSCKTWMWGKCSLRWAFTTQPTCKFRLIKLEGCLTNLVNASGQRVCSNCSDKDTAVIIQPGGSSLAWQS